MADALPALANLDWLRKTAKQHLRTMRLQRREAKLAEAQLAVARRYGFASWRREPRLINAVGPHPYWGGRPRALHVSIETKRRDMFDLLLAAGADINGANEQYEQAEIPCRSSRAARSCREPVAN